MRSIIRVPRRRRHALIAALLSITLSAVASGQESTMMNLAGPRVGVTVMSPGIVDRLKREDIKVSGVVTQFGWQSESRFYSNPSGFYGVTEYVFLVGGTEQGQVLPSFTWLVGFRNSDGIEFGVGPNVTPISTSLAVAGGITYRFGDLNVPVNLALVPSASGVRVSVLTGFNMRKR